MAAPLRKKKLKRGEGKFGVEIKRRGDKKFKVLKDTTFRTKKRAKEVIREVRGRGQKGLTKEEKKESAAAKIRIIRFK